MRTHCETATTGEVSSNYQCNNIGRKKKQQSHKEENKQTNERDHGKTKAKKEKTKKRVITARQHPRLWYGGSGEQRQAHDQQDVYDHDDAAVPAADFTSPQRVRGRVRDFTNKESSLSN